MINIRSIDLNSFEKLGSGSFGTVYKADDTYAYKIYHDFIPFFKRRTSTLKFNRLMHLDKMLSRNELVKDVINVDGRLRGVLITYYNGK